jgi:hypothetical protein
MRMHILKTEGEACHKGHEELASIEVSTCPFVHFLMLLVHQASNSSCSALGAPGVEFVICLISGLSGVKIVMWFASVDAFGVEFVISSL